MSRATAQSNDLTFNKSDCITVRLADGKTVQTTAHTIATLQIGELSVQQRFEILDAEVATILGMPFLETCNPQINWRQKVVRIKYKGRLLAIPTIGDVASTTQQPSNTIAISKNSFADLDIEDTTEDYIISNNGHDDDLNIVGTSAMTDEQSRANLQIKDELSEVKTANSHQPVACVHRREHEQQCRDHRCTPRVSQHEQLRYRDALKQELKTCQTLQQMLAVCAQFDVAHPLSTTSAVSAQANMTEQSCRSIERVSLHAFVHGYKRNSYRDAFVMIGQDVVDQANACDAECNSATANFTIGDIDTSNVDTATVEQCKLVGGLSVALHALNDARSMRAPVAQLSCPHCSFPHLDTLATCHTASRTYVCKNAACRKQYRNSSGAFGNPLAAYSLDKNTQKIIKNNLAQLKHIHRHAHGEQGKSDYTSLQALAERTMSTLKDLFGSVFTEPKFPIERPSHHEHIIRLIDPQAPPPKRRLYPLSDAELIELKEQIELFLQSNRIKPSSSPYGAPILFARKKDGKLRMCIDYRALNSQTIPDSFPLPRIDELLQRIQGARYFSKLDLRDGYHQIPVATESRPLTAFTCRYGTFEWHVMPFGLCNAPGTFQRVMNDVFFELLDRGVLVYLDDILIYSRTQADHIQLLKDVFAILQKNNLFIKESKCALFLEHVEFLGHVISADGVAVETGKIDAVKNWPTPKNVTEVQQFMGLANYYRKFIFKFSEIAVPLTSLTRKNVLFSWTSQQQQSFDRIKSLLCSAPVLKVFDNTLDTRIICDASDFAIGSVLEQKHGDNWHPVEFMSKSLNSAEKNYSATDREFVAVRYSLEKWQHLLANKPFLIYTDHAALTYLQSSSHVSRRNARWLEFLAQFSFQMLHIRGDSNVADHLSRITPADAAHLGAFISVFDKSALFDAIRLAQSRCAEPWFLSLREKAEQQASRDSSVSPAPQLQGAPVLQVRNDILCILRDDYFCPVVPRDTDIIAQILRDLHASSLGGHLGFAKLYRLVQRRFYWHNMRRDIDKFCRACVVCQQNKHSTQKPAGELQPLPVPTSCFESISMDFVTHLPLSDGYDSIFTIVDRFSKFVRFIPIQSTYDAPKIAQLLFDNWICIYGMPKVIVSDRDSRFTSRFWQSLMQLLQCKTAMSSAYHPQSDGQTERFHRTIEQVLRCFCSDRQSDWCGVLQQCSFSLNSSVHQATQQSPFFTVFLRHPRLPIDAAFAQVQDCPVDAVEKLVRSRASTDEVVRAHIEQANRYAAAYANKHRRHVEFAVDDLVLLSTQNLPLPPPLSRKLAPKFIGPLRVTARVGAVAYRLELPPALARLHDVFHVGLLKPFVGQPPPVREPVFTADDGDVFEVEKILGHRVVRRRHQFLVQWRGYPVWEASWEPEEHLEGCEELLSEFKRARGLS